MCPNRPYFVAIPTTSGTGSEVTSFAILTHQGVKHPLVEAHIRPDLAILDDSLLGNLPQSLIADGGMDALSHCAEALVAKNSSPFTQALAVSAFQTLTELLPQSYEGDSSVRGKLHCAATMAGIAFDHSGLGICHSLSHALGGRFHVPHGRLNAILLPHVIGFNRSHCSYLPLGTNVVFGLSRLRRRLGLPQSLKEVGISREALHTALEDLAIATLEDPCTATNPRPVTLEDCKTLLKECL
jgi:alcohol dehydrogenase class IV